MGQAAFINQTPNPAARRSLRLADLGFDYILIAATTALVIFGLLMVYSASSVPANQYDKASDYFVQRQILWAFMGVVAIAGIVWIGYRNFKRWSVSMILIMLVMLALVQVIGFTSLGAVRSMMGASVRPSELAKIVTIIYVAVWLDSKRDVLHDMTLGLLPLIAILGVTGGLIIIQPDISAGLTIVILGGLMFFLAGGEWRQIAIVILLAFLASILMVTFYATAASRVDDYVAGLKDITQASDHIVHSFEAIVAGGFFGKGIGQGSIKSIGLPVAHTDSIFAVVAEETGLIGILFLLAGYFVIGWRGMVIARDAADPFGRLLAAGITFWLILEAAINIGVMVNLLPNAGNALPFISYGGSSMLTNLAGIGILLSISRSGQQKRHEGETTFGSVVNLRWRDGRRRVPRSGRPTSTH